MYDKSIHLDERSFVEQQIESLARGQLPLLMLRFEPLFPAPFLRLGAPLFEEIEFVTHCHKPEKLTFVK